MVQLLTKLIRLLREGKDNCGIENVSNTTSPEAEEERSLNRPCPNSDLGLLAEGEVAVHQTAELHWRAAAPSRGVARDRGGQLEAVHWGSGEICRRMSATGSSEET